MSDKVYAPDAIARLKAAGYNKTLTQQTEDGSMMFEAYRSTADDYAYVVILTHNQRAFLLQRVPWEELSDRMSLNPS